ncbi:DUF5681 domain-containing protein [Sphingomonas sp. SUN019]|uniref:DUF5681 domain-containing protein n=1 Tax=Sphingomonas sp. SUN019 TaxID=2937788 RepID=UPI00216404F8|nr:DUF5681 domain-containing protein [Sphingomonas sp. SUN019]UVO50173.1 DUF5681 domain-containing protein [Sphingomonas sp. SUN019]
MTKKVGYKSPPDHTKWSKGQSGNPSGRKKGQRNLVTDLAEEMAATVQVTEGGRPLRLTKQRALIRGLVARSIKGDARAVAQLLQLLVRLPVDETADPATSPADADDEAIIAAFLARRMKGTPEK